MTKKRIYISENDPAKIEILLGRQYIVTDYRGNLLPGTVTPFKKDGKWFICKNERGGHVWHKPGEFVRPAGAADV